MKSIAVGLALVCALSGAARADDYLVCSLAGTNTKCPGNAKLPAGFFVALANVPSLPASKITSGIFLLARIPVLDVAHLPTGIPAPYIGAGTVDDTEFGYVDGVLSPIQAQLDSKAPAFGSQTANTIYAAPNGLSGLPTFRRLVAVDTSDYITQPSAAGGTFYDGGSSWLRLPAGPADALYQSNGAAAPSWVTSLTGITINGATNTLLNIGNGSLVNSSLSVSVGSGLLGVGCSPVALGGTCTVSLTVVPIANGGTGSATFNANEVLAGPVSGGAAAPTRRVLSAANITYTSGTPPFSSGSTIKDAIDLLIASAASQVAVSFSVVPGIGDIGKIYRLNTSGLAVVAQGDSLTDVTAIRGAYQGNAGYLSGGLGDRLSILLESGLSGPLAPSPGMPVFVSVTNAGKGTTQDPIDLGTVGSYSAQVAVIEDASAYSAVTGGLVTAQWLQQLPIGPLGTALSPPSNPPYYVDPKVYTCPSGSVAGNLVAQSGTNNTFSLADRTLGLPAVRRIYVKLTSTTCQVYALNLSIAGGGAVAGSIYYLGTAGGMTTTIPTTSGEILQRVAISDSTTTILPDIDVQNWQVLP